MFEANLQDYCMSLTCCMREHGAGSQSMLCSHVVKRQVNVLVDCRKMNMANVTLLKS